MFNNIGELCPKFKDPPNEATFIWLFTNALNWNNKIIIIMKSRFITFQLDFKGGIIFKEGRKSSLSTPPTQKICNKNNNI